MILFMLIVALSMSVIFGSFNGIKSLCLVFLLFILTIIVAFPNSSVADTTLYQYLYDFNYNSESYNIGFLLYIRLFKLFGFSYSWFRIINYVIVLLLIIATIKRFIPKLKNYFFVFYFVFPFVYDAIQIRNTLMMAIMLYGCSFLINVNKKNVFIASLLIFISGMVQEVGFIYLLVPIILVFNLKWKRFLKYFVFLMGIIGFLMTNDNFRNIVISKIVLKFSNFEKVGVFFVKGSVNNGWILNGSITVLTFVIIYGCYWFIKKLKLHDEVSKLYLCLVMASVGLITIPLSFIDGNFIRIVRNVIPMAYIAYLIFMTKSNNFIGKSFITMSMLMLVSICIFSEFIDVQSSIHLLIHQNTLIPD